MVRIAVVDDQKEFVELMAEILGERGWDVTTFVNSEGVVQSLTSNPPDLAVVDIRMEDADSGWRLIECLLAEERTQHMGIVVCSAGSRELARRAEWMSERDIVWLDKPFDTDQLYRVIENQLRLRITTTLEAAGE